MREDASMVVMNWRLWVPIGLLGALLASWWSTSTEYEARAR